MRELRNIQTKGIVLKKYPSGENDFSVYLYSPDLGKICANVKGARKINSSFSGHVETMNLCQFQLYKSAYRYTIVQCQCLQNFKKIREDFDRSMMAGLMMEIFHKSTLSSEHSAELFDLLRQSLHKLNDSPQHFLTIEGFKLNLLKSIGVLPDMESCASCHERWNIDHSIWLENSGHLHCQECSSSHAAANPKNQGINATYHPKAIDFNIIKLISYLTQPIDRQTKTISFNSRQKEQLRHITHFFLQHFIEREIMSERLLPDI